jgi:HAD superfamily hydrolase (TIGR01509 family)
MSFRAVLWDIDGTLLDSEPRHFAAMEAVCVEHGALVVREEIERFLGQPLGAVFAHITATHRLPMDLKGFAYAVTARYVAEAHTVPFRPGGVERVDRLAARGLPQACVSNSGRPVVEANYARLARPALSFALSRDDVVNGKPDPEPYLMAAERLGVAPSACIAVEDSPVGARSAKAAGMLTVAWPQDPHLVFDAADLVVTHLEEVEWEQLIR